MRRIATRSQFEAHDAGDYIVSLISEEAGWTTPATEQKRRNGHPNLFSGSANVCTRIRVAVRREARGWVGMWIGRQVGRQTGRQADRQASRPVTKWPMR
jgi:hypothetical protein